ncbi:kinase-like domain-containing protein [Gamsiella multidivaricata]|uniref:kinase-like domain-containing protein n=1 Tax=Gamsiella multidivaricata TaxID=101098 RepID=UPI0022210687|nr:kinase-like domain-containing protein [Gamsiella multidivaricata]KAI7818394.1 kinase-like domain-containing protein [Gamsiella multidivaricata]
MHELFIGSGEQSRIFGHLLLLSAQDISAYAFHRPHDTMEDPTILIHPRFFSTKFPYPARATFSTPAQLAAPEQTTSCYGVERDNNYVYIITDYAEGGNLTEALPKLDWESKRRIVAEVAQGLAYLHSKGIVHRDIKEENILLTKHWQVKLCDFGLANVMASATQVSSFKAKGTPGYIAPELINTNPKYSTKSDIFALGIIMGKMVEKDAPSDFTTLMKRCLDNDPEKRPTASDIVDGLQVVATVRSDAGGDSAAETAHSLSANDEYDLGIKFYDGDGVDVNRAEAAERFRRAANMGLAKAQHQLATMYSNGDGVLRDMAKAIGWFQKAAKQEYAPAQSDLGFLYLFGGKGDSKQGSELIMAAASQSHAAALVDLGFMLETGLGGCQDHESARRFYLMAAELGDAEAQTILGSLYMEEENYAKAIEWLSKATEKGYAPAQCNMGTLYHRGQGVTKNDSVAAGWFEKAADQGNPAAQCRLGAMYIRGKGVLRRNASKGLRLLHKAAEQGSAEAQTALGAYGVSL